MRGERRTEITPPLLGVDSYLADVLEQVGPLPPIGLSLLDASGCVLAADIHAAHPLPSFDNSSMDGYAVIAADLARASRHQPVRLRVVDDVPAGFVATEVVQAGVAVRIMTGAPIPDGADAVVQVERTDGGERVVAIYEPVPPGANIRRLGEDVLSGEVVLRAGTLLTERQIALLAALGHDSVLVHPRPRVVVVSTGSELVEPGGELRRGLIHDSNSFLLVAATLAAGAIAYRLPPLVDDEELVLTTLQDQLHRADLVLTTGGVSMGAYDPVKAALKSLGTFTFTKVAMNPGMPQGFGVLQDGSVGGLPVLTLPGNPVSAFVSFEAFARPVIRRMQGRAEIHRPTVRALAACDFRSPSGKRQFARGRFTSASPLAVEPVGGQGSHVLGGLAQAECLIVIPENVSEIKAGEPVTVWDLRS